MIVEKIRNFSSELKGYRVFFFGSRVTGKARHRSDFDIGIDGAKPLPAALFFSIEEALESLPTLYRIDWVDMGRISPSFKKQAMGHIEMIYG